MTDISGIITAVSGYWEAILVVGVAMLAWGIGKKVVRRGT